MVELTSIHRHTYINSPSAVRQATEVQGHPQQQSKFKIKVYLDSVRPWDIYMFVCVWFRHNLYSSLYSKKPKASSQHFNLSPLTKASQDKPWKGQPLLGGEHHWVLGFLAGGSQHWWGRDCLNWKTNLPICSGPRVWIRTGSLTPLPCISPGWGQESYPYPEFMERRKLKECD